MAEILRSIAMPGGPEPPVMAIKNPRFPQYRFEWHRVTKKVYLIRLLTAPNHGDPIAENVPNHGAAINAVNTWCRGYKERDALIGEKTPQGGILKG